MMNSFFRPPEPLQYDNLPTMIANWKTWIKEFATFLIATKNSDESDAVKVSMFLNLIGHQGVELYESFGWAHEGDNMIFDEVIKRFEIHMTSNNNLTVNRFEFFNYSQKEGQSIDDFMKELIILRKECEFASDTNINDTLLRDQIISGLVDKALQQKLLRLEPSKSNLATIMSTCRLHEISKDHAAKLDTEEQKLHQINRQQPSTHGRRYGNWNGNGMANGNMAQQEKNNRRFQQPPDNRSSMVYNCRFCADNHPRGQCSAYNQLCPYCNKRNHSEKACEKKKRDLSNRQPVRSIEHFQDHSENNDQVFFMSQIGRYQNQNGRDWNVQLMVNQSVSIQFKIDSGAEESVISKDAFDRIQCPPMIHKTSTRLCAYNKTEIPVIGKCILNVQFGQGEQRSLDFMIARYDSVISGKHAEELNLIQRLFLVNKVPPGVNEDIFCDIGCINGELKIHLKDDAVPVIQPPRRIPHSMMGRLKTEIDRMESMGVIYPINEPTDWVSSLVIQTKDNGKLRICLDPKHLNSAIKRQHYPIPTSEEIFDKLVGAKVFSKLDCSSGYWQIKVCEESSKLLCFNTPFGRYCFTRLPFGIHIASEVFQQKLEAVLEGLDGVANSQDDMIVWGKDKQEHDQRLKLVMDTIYESGFRLNKEKCKFGVSDLIFLGHRITDNGIYPDPDKIAAVNAMEVPKDKKGVQRLLGMVNYLSKFIPDVSNITAPLRKLIEKESKFEIAPIHLESIGKIKNILTSNPVLQVFDSQKETKIAADASMYGLGAVLLQKHNQEWLPVAYASRSLTSAEKRYAQIEKECLAAVFACKKFHMYVYGRPFVVENDHKPLQTIIGKDMNQMPARITRMMLELIRYPDLTFRYIPGTHLKIPDALSRAPHTTTTSECPDIERQVHAISESFPGTNEVKKRFQDETAKDDTMQTILSYIEKGWPEHKSCPKYMEHYWSIQDEISENQGIIYKAQQIIVPRSMRQYVKEMIHKGHLGIVKCKERARSYFYWPGMNKEVEQMVHTCSTCQEYRNKQPKEPNMAVIDQQPWSTIGCDIFHIQQYHYLIMVDYYSSYPEVVLLNKGAAHGTSRTTVDKMKQTFAQHGIPNRVISDGGPQFMSHQFNEFAKEWNFQHEPSSPEYPRGNGRVERAVQTVKKLIKKAVQSRQDVNEAILAYRTTPLQDSRSPMSPAELLMGRLPRNHLNNHIEAPFQPQGNDTKCSYEEKYTNQHAKQLSPLQPGDNVRMWHKGTWSQKAKVVAKHHTPRSFVVQAQEGKQYRRNRQHLLRTQEEFMIRPNHQMLDDDVVYVPDSDIDPTSIPLPDTNDDDLDETANISNSSVVEIPESDRLVRSPPIMNETNYRRFSNRTKVAPRRLDYHGLGKPTT